MSKFHIGKNGKAMPCTAKGVCPLGGEHFDTIEKAEEYAYQKNAVEYGLLGNNEEVSLDSKLEVAYSSVTALTEEIEVIDEGIHIYEEDLEAATNDEDRDRALSEIQRLGQDRIREEEKLRASQAILNGLLEESYNEYLSRELLNEQEELGVEEQNRLDSRFERLEELSNHLGSERTLDELSKSLSDEALREGLSSIVDQHGLMELADEDEDESRFDNINAIVDILGHDETLDSLAKSTSAKQLADSLELIADDNGYRYSDDMSHWDHDSLYNTDNYMYEDDPEYAKMELEYAIEANTVKPRGEVVEYAMISKRTSRYGSIGGAGAEGYRGLNSGADLARGLLGVNTDTIKLNDSDGILAATFHDHDGVHHTEIKPIVKSREAKYRRMMENAEHDEILEYLKGIPSIKMKKK